MNKKYISCVLGIFCLMFSLLAFEGNVKEYDFSDVEATKAFKEDLNSSIVKANEQYQKIEEERLLAQENKDTTALAQEADYFLGVVNKLKTNLDSFTLNEKKYQNALAAGDKVIADKLAQDAALIASDVQKEIAKLNLNIKKVSEQLGVREVSDSTQQQKSSEKKELDKQDTSTLDPTLEAERKGIDFSEAEETEQESELMASLVDGFIEYILGAIFIQWGADLYVSLPDFGYAIFKLLFGDVKLDWSPLAFNFTDMDLKMASAVQDGNKKVAIADALSLFSALQDYKVYFQNLVVSYLEDGSLSSSEKKWLDREGKILNTIEYRIEKLDESVLDEIDNLFINPQQISLIKSIVNGLSKKDQFSWLILDAISPSKTESNIITISKLDLVTAMKTMQRFEGAFLAQITSFLDTKILPSENEKNTLISLANLLNNFSVKIENQDPQVFLDLATAESQIQQFISAQNQIVSNQINAMKNVIAKYSSQSQSFISLV